MITNIVISLLGVAGFGLVLLKSRIAEVAAGAMKATQSGLAAMTDSELDDDAKEIAVRKAGIGLIGASFSIFWRFAAALAAAAAPILLADALGLADQAAVFGLMLRLDYIVVVSVLAILLVEILRRRRRTDAETASESNRYSAGDRFFHMAAFSSPVVLRAASALEDRVIGGDAEVPEKPPVFITSLARGGTTAVLNALYDVPAVATHTYRDMPFLTAPSLWNRLAGGSGRGVERHQRAHGDGLEIDLESPEAFEEVIWKMFWPEKFRGAAIDLWRPGDAKPEAERFLRRHMAKIIRARRSQNRPGASRYVSKNNANIGRIPYLTATFPESRIVVPLRRPETHAASLLRQHRNFLDQQAGDDFIRRYMRDIGHFEFGLIHKPIAFPGFDPSRYDAAAADYWLAYWIHACQEILRHRDSCLFVLQDDLRTAPQETMAALCRALDLDPGGTRFTGHFRQSPDRTSTEPFDPALLAEATDLYRDLESHARQAG